VGTAGKRKKGGKKGFAEEITSSHSNDAEKLKKRTTKGGGQFLVLKAPPPEKKINNSETGTSAWNFFGATARHFRRRQGASPATAANRKTSSIAGGKSTQKREKTRNGPGKSRTKTAVSFTVEKR